MINFSYYNSSPMAVGSSFFSNGNKIIKMKKIMNLTVHVPYGIVYFFNKLIWYADLELLKIPLCFMPV